MLHVLLVEDNPADVLLIREAMRTSPIAADVIIAYDGEQARNLLRQGRYDLIILDLNIPKFDGYRLLREYRLYSGPPVVVFTGSQSPNDRNKALALGATDYFVKPANVGEFMSVVRGILELWIGNASSLAEV
jgi:DNA-binding response OmpR family regulator